MTVRIKTASDSPCGSRTSVAGRASNSLLLYLGIACVVSSATYFVTAFSDRGSTPAAVIDVAPLEFNFGTVPQQAVVTSTFHLQNRSSEPLNLVSVDPGCACTTVEFVPQSLAPDAVVALTLRLHVGTSRGELRKVAIVNYSHASDDRRGHVPLTMIGVVQPDYSVSPESMSFSSTGRQTAAVTFSPLSDRDTVIERVYVTHRAFSVEQSPLTESESMLTVGFDPAQWSLSDGDRAALVICTNSRSEPDFHVPLKVVAINKIAVP